MLESVFQKALIRKIQKLYPSAIILKNDANYIQGIPDWLILEGSHWAAFDAKASSRSTHRPNQEYYIRKMNGMSLADFVYPENAEAFLNELYKTLRP
jgi:hypothetical protein